MSKGICRWSSVAIRGEASHCSEMVSQLLFGETYDVLEETTEWVKICTSDCHYEGWISLKQHTPLTENQFESYSSSKKYKVSGPCLMIHDGQAEVDFPIFCGSTLPCTDKTGHFSLGDYSYTAVLNCKDAPAQTPEALMQTAFSYLNTPYLWGGRTPAGIDCSGFVQIVFSVAGILLPRDASQQVAEGQTVDFLHEAQVGDVAFFENEEGNIVHVGIICSTPSEQCDNFQIIHSSGFVQVNILDENGIFNQNLKKYTHKLRIIKRILAE